MKKEYQWIAKWKDAMRPGELEEIKEKPETMEIDPRTPYESLRFLTRSTASRFIQLALRICLDMLGNGRVIVIQHWRIQRLICFQLSIFK